MNRNLFLNAIVAVGLSIFSFGCAGAPVKVGEGPVEKPLQEVSGITTEDVQKALKKETLNLMDVYSLAVKRTETLATASESVLQAKSQNAQAVGAWLPQVYLGDMKKWQYSAVPNNSLSLSVSETILGGLNQVAAIQGAGANIDYQNNVFKNQSRLLLLNVATAFYNVLSLEESLEALQTSKELNEKTLGVEKQWQKMGRSRTADVSNTQAQLAQILADLQNTKYQLVQAREVLATLADIKNDQHLVSEETYSTPSFTLDEAQGKVESRPDVQSAAASVVVADAYLLQAHGGHLPTISVEGQYYLSQDGINSSNDWNATFLASLPIFEGGQVIAQEDEASSKKRQAEMQLSLTRRTAVDDIREAYKSLVESIGETEAYQKAEQSYEQAYQDVLHDYKLNLTTNLELLQTMTALENTKISYIKAKYQALYDQIWLGVATSELPKIKE